MKNSARDSARAAVRGALARGTQGARAVLTRERESSVEWRDGKLDRLRESTSVGLNLSLFVDGRFSTHDTSDLRPEALGTFFDEAVAMTRLLETDLAIKTGKLNGDFALNILIAEVAAK